MTNNDILFDEENISNTPFQPNISSPQFQQSISNPLPQLSTSNSATINKGVKRKITKDDIGEKVVGMIRNIYENRAVRDEFVIFGEDIANSIRKLNTDYARNTVKFKIQTVLYEASLVYYDQPPNMAYYPPNS